MDVVSLGQIPTYIAGHHDDKDGAFEWRPVYSNLFAKATRSDHLRPSGISTYARGGVGSPRSWDDKIVVTIVVSTITHDSLCATTRTVKRLRDLLYLVWLHHTATTAMV